MTLFLVCKILFTSLSLLDENTPKKLLRTFTTAVAIVAVAIPEGLPLAVSISMAFSVDTMKRDNLLVKKTVASENLGYIKEILTGKTATLTKNEMRVQEYIVGRRVIEHHPNSLNKLNDNVRELITNSIILNNDARVEMSEDALYIPNGNGTEVAMLKFLQDNDVAIQDLMTERNRRAEFECCIPFNPNRKRMATVYRPFNGCNYVRIVVKGAPEYVIKYCNKKLSEDGTAYDLSEEEKLRYINEEVVEQFAKRGLRTFLYAYKDIDSDHWEYLQAQNNNFAKESDRDIIESDLTVVATFGLVDELRHGIDTSIAKLRAAGINTRMISGDNLETAIYAAKKAGILQEGEERVPFRCMTGEEFRTHLGGVFKVVDKTTGQEKWAVDKKKFKPIGDNIKVLARAHPEDKFALVAALQFLGSSVAVTADGINDKGALVTAHVGFCMGKSGCEAAKDASDIIILDDNFCSVFRAVQWGRNMIDNIRKFIQFQLGINIVCLLLTFLGGLSLGNAPFSVT
jgi:magnesium-transporting ATPase (P-type)